MSSAGLPAAFGPVAGELEAIARATGLIVRNTPSFSAGGFCLSMLKAACDGHASFNQLAMSLGRLQQRTMTKQALHARINAKAADFLDEVLRRIVEDKTGMTPPDGKRPFARILLQDSTQLKTHRANHAAFPACGNDKGKTAGAKVDWRLDSLSGLPLPPKQTGASTQDRTLGPEMVEEIEPRDLLLRDMGYFSMADFQAIEAKGAWWISRLHGLVEVHLEDGTPLEDYLASCGPGRIDITVRLGTQRHPARLTAVRVPEEVASRRRAKRRAKAAKHGNEPASRALWRDDWTIHITNIGANMLDAETVALIYGLRWEIEIKFRAWKQSTGMQAALARISNRHHLRALLVAAMIFFALGLRTAQRLAQAHPGARVSFEKVCDWLSRAITSASGLASAVVVDIRHLNFDRRKKRMRLRDSIRTLN
jgi:hypothetical protein